MKTITLIISLFLLSFNLTAQENGIRFANISLEEAREKAANATGDEPKIIFIDCFTTWCGYCKAMERDVFSLPAVGDYFNKTFICLSIDMEKGEGIDICKKFNVVGFPEYLFLDANGEQVLRFGGARTAESFLALAKRLYIKPTIPGLKEAYDKKHSLKNAAAYLLALGETLDSSLPAEAMRIFNSLKTKERYSETFWPALSAALYDPLGDLFNAVLKEYPAASKRLGNALDDRLRTGIHLFTTYYTRGFLPETPTEEIIEKIQWLDRVAKDDPATPHIIKLVDLFRAGNTEAIKAMRAAPEVKELPALARIIATVRI